MIKFDKIVLLSAWVGRLVQGPGWLRYGAVLLWGASLGFLSWWLLLQELQLSLSSQGSAQQADATQQAERDAAMQQVERQRALVRAQKNELIALEAALPDASEVQDAWATVHQASRKHGLRMEFFKPGPMGSEKPYPQQRASLRLSGSFEALLAFTRTLAVASTPVTIESFSLVSNPSGADSGNSLLFFEAVMLSLHQPAAASSANTRAVPLDAVPSPLLGAAAGTAMPVVMAQDSGRPGASSDPFESQRLVGSPQSAGPVSASPSASTATPAHALKIAPLASMRLMGSVQSAGKMTALVMAGGMLHAVRVGDALGNARGQVTDIRADAITVREFSRAGATESPREVILSLAKN